MKCNSKALEHIVAKVWANCRSVTVDASGASGGLAIIWDPQVLSLYDFHASHYFIQTTFHLVDLNSLRRFPLWICGGDFNMTTSFEEKSGGRHRLDGDYLGFKDFILSNQLMDLHTSNGTYTWTNKRRGSQHIASRLDRFLMSDNALHLGGDFHSSILPLARSDHWPILLQRACPGSCCNRPFLFELF
eukprot:PITA_18098